MSLVTGLAWLSGCPVTRRKFKKQNENGATKTCIVGTIIALSTLVTVLIKLI